MLERHAADAASAPVARARAAVGSSHQGLIRLWLCVMSATPIVVAAARAATITAAQGQLNE